MNARRLTSFASCAFVVLSAIASRAHATPERATAFSLIIKDSNVDLAQVHSRGEHRRALEKAAQVVLHFDAFGESFDVELEETEGSVFAANANVVVQRSDGSESFTPYAGGVKTYRAAGDKVDAVLTVSGHAHLEGLILKDGEDIHFERDGDGPLLAEKNGSDGACGDAPKPTLPSGVTFTETPAASGKKEKLRGVRQLGQVEKWDGCFPGDENLHVVKMGLAVGSKLYSKLGSVDAAVAYVEGIIAQTNLVYERQVGVSIRVDQLNIQTVSNAVVWDKHCVGQNIYEQLNQFRSWVEHDAPTSSSWHVLDDCFVGSSGVIGLAYVGTMCWFNGNSFGYNTGVTHRGFNTWKTLAHEIGHSFGAHHSFEEGQGKTGGIMDYGDGKYEGEYQFNTQYRKSEICNVISNAVLKGCSFIQPAEDVPLATFAPTSKPTSKPTSTPTVSTIATPAPTRDTCSDISNKRKCWANKEGCFWKARKCQMRPRFVNDKHQCHTITKRRQCSSKANRKGCFWSHSHRCIARGARARIGK